MTDDIKQIQSLQADLRTALTESALKDAALALAWDALRWADSADELEDAEQWTEIPADRAILAFDAVWKSLGEQIPTVSDKRADEVGDRIKKEKSSDSFVNNDQRVDWPTKPGYYWFYGYRYGKFDGNGEICAEPELVLCNAIKCANGFMITGDGQFLYKSEVEQANFIPATLPELMEID